MKILVIGGLGYLGWHIYDNLCMRYAPECIDIMDINLFEKWTKEELDALPEGSYTDTDIAKVPIKELLESYDEFYIASDIDVLVYDKFDELAEYSKRYHLAINRLLASGKVTLYCSARGMIPFISDELRCNMTGVPQLFGISRAFRNDLFINDMVMALASEEQYTMEDDPFQIISFANVQAFAKSVVFNSPCPMASLPKIMIANLIQRMFPPNVAVNLVPELGSTLTVSNEEICIGPDVVRSLEMFVNEITRGLETARAVELLGKKYNNLYTVHNIVEGLKYSAMFKL